MAWPFRSLSSRVVLGFAILIATFGITLALIFSYMRQVGAEIAVIRTVYLRMALLTKDLARKQDELQTYLVDEVEAETERMFETAEELPEESSD